MIFMVIAVMLLTLAIASNVTAKERPLDLLFDQADANHDGVVSEQEFHNYMQQRFTTIDADKDGNLTREELEDARQAIRDRIIDFRKHEMPTKPDN